MGVLLAAIGASPSLAAMHLLVEAPRLAVRDGGDSGYQVDLDLPRLELRRGAAPGPSRIELRGAAITLHGPGEGDPARATLEGAIERGEGAEAWTGEAVLALTEGRVAVHFVEVTAPARVETGVVVDEGGPAFRGAELNAAGLAIERVAGTDVEARFDFADLAFEVAALRFGWFGGTWDAVGRVSLAEEDFDATLKSTPTDLARLVVTVLEVPPDDDMGDFLLDGRVRGDWRDPDHWLATLEGDGSIGVVGGTIPSFAIFASVWNALFERIPGVRALELDPGRGSPTRLEEIRYPFQLRDSRLSTEELIIEADDYRAEGGGSLGLDGSLDMEMTVAFTAQGRRKVFSMTRLPGSREVVPIPPVPVEMTGSIREPTVEADVSGVSAQTLVALLGQVRGAPAALGGLVGDTLRQGSRLVRDPRRILPGADGTPEE